MGVAFAHLLLLLAPVLDADRLVGFHHVGDFQFWIHLLGSEWRRCVLPDDSTAVSLCLWLIGALIDPLIGALYPQDGMSSTVIQRTACTFLKCHENITQKMQLKHLTMPSQEWGYLHWGKVTSYFLAKPRNWHVAGLVIEMPPTTIASILQQELNGIPEDK